MTFAEDTLNLSVDNKIDTSNLEQEFRVFPSTLYAYCEVKSSAQEIHDRLKSKLEEMEATVYIEIKSSPEKATEAHVAAKILLDPRVKGLRDEVMSANRDLETAKNYVESLRAKKDMLIQLGADARKE